MMGGALAGGPKGPNGPSVPGDPDVPVPIVPPSGPIVPSSYDLTFGIGPYFDGELLVYGSTVEIFFSQQLCISSITFTNLNDGKSRSVSFGNLTTNHVVMSSPISSNGLWDICVRVGNVDYHAAVYVDCYQSMYECPMD